MLFVLDEQFTENWPKFGASSGPVLLTGASIWHLIMRPDVGFTSLQSTI